MTRMQKSKFNKQTPRTVCGFSIIEMMITATVLTIVTGFGVMGISRAKANIRLSGAAHEFASYVEKARVYSIRRHADDASKRANLAINADQTSYNVTMDTDGDGVMETRTITLPAGVSFKTVETIAFDWRGRTWNTVGASTMPNAQVSIILKNTFGTMSIDITGSGDVTIDSAVFDDKVPNVNLKVGDLAAGATPVPTPSGLATATPTPGATPDLGITPNPTPTPDLGRTISLPTPTPSATATPTPNPTPTPSPSQSPSPSPTPSPTPSPSPTATPRPTPTPLVCTLGLNLTTVVMHRDATATINVGVTGNGAVSVSGTSSNASNLQVSPGGAQTVGAGSYTTFTIKSKKTIGTYLVTFSSSCDTKIVTVSVIL